MQRIQIFFLTAAILLTPLATQAEDSPPATPAVTSAPKSETSADVDRPKTRAEALLRKGIKTTEGPATVQLGAVASYQLQEGQLFIGPDSIARFLELTHNTPSGDELGVVMDPAGWLMCFDFADIGYVKDDEKDKLDAEKLLSSMRENQDEANRHRVKQGWDELKIQGWATPPHYDDKTNNLTWALKLTSAQDNHKEVWINENIRLLGRGGYMNVTLVADTEIYTSASEATANLLTSNFHYTPGNRYAEWKQGDKIAAVGLSALVMGGGAVMASKMGLFGKIGVFLAKLGKGVFLLIAAVGAGLVKLFRKITGSHPSE
jgi:uncharacterized membrane-anchored protein